MLRVGTAGWSYADWEGIVYPRGASTRRTALTLLSNLFEVLEINVTFYRPPSRRMASTWVERVTDRPAFRFTAKLWRGFTHDRERAHAREEREFREGIEPLVSAGRLGAILMQFPHSFLKNRMNHQYLETLLSRFADLPRVVELRHRSWHDEEIRTMLREKGAGLCNVDQPAADDTVPPTDFLTSPTGYVRLHGRNAEAWFRKEAGRDERYDYLYSDEEIREWGERVRRMQRRSAGADIFVIANNHYRGQAPANALELIALLTGKPVPVPAGLLRAYPRLEAIADRLGPPGESGTLPL